MLAACGAPEFVTLSGQTMGTYYAVRVQPSEVCQVEQLRFDDLLIAVNQQMSTYETDSELSALNNNPSTEWLPISPELAEVLGTAQQIWQRSDGAFDVTIGPLINLWGFGPESGQDIPDLAAQRAAASRVGMAKLGLAGTQLKKTIPDLYIDLSALAKGYGVDVLARRMEELGCTDYMADIGGEIRVRGLSPQGQPWRIGIEVPDPGRLGTLQTVLNVTDVSVATSGDYRNFRMVDGKRVDHVLDPVSGKPAENNVVSATVLHPSAMWADAYATTLMVLGLERGLQFADAEGIPAYIMTRRTMGQSDDEDRFEASYNTAMRAFLPD